MSDATWYEIAPAVRAQLTAGDPVGLVRTVDVEGMSSRWEGQVVAAIGEVWAGGLIAGAADHRIRPLLREAAHAPATVTAIRIDDAEATAAGLACGGRARVLVQPATDVPAKAWTRLAERQPICLLTDLDGATPGRTTWFAPAADAGDRHPADLIRWFGRGLTATTVVALPGGGSALATSLWPVTRMLVVGDGLLADALLAQANLLGWQAEATRELGAALPAIGRLTPADALVVLTHDREVDGPVLQAALATRPGYIGALGSRRTQAARAGWLAERGLGADVVREIHGPAGLDLGARTPAEIALAITAEILAVRSGGRGSGLRDSSGPIHHDGLNTPPARYPQAGTSRT